MSELTAAEREEILARAGYTADVDEGKPEPPKVEKPEKKRKKADTKQEVTATSPLYDNDWQNEQFAARKAVVGRGFTKEEAAVHNKALWKSLGEERLEHNRAVRTAQRELSGTGAMREVLLAERETKESVDDLVRALRESGLDPDMIREAAKRLQ